MSAEDDATVPGIDSLLEGTDRSVQYVGRAGISVDSDVVPVIAGTLYYELRVAYESMGSRQARRKFNEDAYRAVKVGFGSYLDKAAVGDHKSLHHVYEWGQLGVESGRLWRLVRAEKRAEDGLTISYNFLNSKVKAPIDSVLSAPGKTGRFVSRSGIFIKKASIMEYGLTIFIKPKRDNRIAFPAPNLNSGIGFTRKTLVVRNPGGKAVLGSFAAHFTGWFGSGMATRYIKADGVFDRIEARAKKAGTMVPVQIKRAGFSRVNSAEINHLAESTVSSL